MNNYRVERISIIIPVRDEAPNIVHLSGEINEAMASQSHPWTALWVDDGSRDDTLSILRRLNREDPRHQYISFQENRGQSAALMSGIKQSRADVIATLDGDGQNDPKDIPRLIHHLYTNDVDMVNGYRTDRRDNLIRKISSRIANLFRNLTTGKTVRDVGCSTRVFKRKCAEDLPHFKGLHRFLPTLISMKGFRLMEVAVNHRPRLKGETKYSINNRLWVGIYDIFGVMWLRHRAFRYSFKEKSQPPLP